MEREEALTRVKKYLSLNDFSQNTIRAYTMLLREFFIFLEQKKLPYETFDREVISDYFLYIKEKGLSAKTRSLIKTAIAYWYRDVLGENIEGRLKFIKIKLRKPLVVNLTPEQAMRFINSLSTEREKMIVKCLYFMGLRVSEVSGITIKNITEKKIFGKGNKERELFIEDKFKEELLSYHKKNGGEDGLIFPYCGERMIQNFIHNHALRLGLEWVHTHTFRKSFATNMINLGHSVQKVARWLGHESIETTDRHYTGKLEHEDRGGLYFK